MDPPELVPPAPAEALQARRDPSETVLIVNDLLAHADAGRLCEHVRAILGPREEVPVVCDVGGLGVIDAATVEALCRLQQAARRYDRGFVLRHAGRDLEDLIAFMGLAECLPIAK